MTKQLLLLGAALAHVNLLAHLGQHPVPGVQVTLITPHPRLISKDMLAGFVAGQHALDDCVIPLEPLVQRSAVRWRATRAVALDAPARAVLLDDGSELHFDWLSINNEPLQDRDAVERAIPGARKNGLFVHPVEAFCALWPSVPELAATRAMRVAVIGGGVAVGDAGRSAGGGNGLSGGVSHDARTGASSGAWLAIELAMAVRQRLPGAAVTLITGGAPVAACESAAVQRRIAQALRRRNVTVLADSATGIQAGEVLLGSGARLACDVPIMATEPCAPAWLADSGLALDAHGFIAVDACQRATRHVNVFATGPVSAQADRHGGYVTSAARAASTLAASLASVMAGLTPAPRQPSTLQTHLHTLRLLSCGDGHAIASWDGYGAEGRWVGWLKRSMDRRLIAKYRGL